MMEVENIDIAIRYMPHDAPHWHVLLDEYLLAVATPEYLRLHPPSATKAWFSSIVLLHDAVPWDGAPPFIEWETWLKAVVPERIDMVDNLQFNLSSLAIRAALNHRGVAVGSSALIAEELAMKRLVPVFRQHVRAPAKYRLGCVLISVQAR